MTYRTEKRELEVLGRKFAVVNRTPEHKSEEYRAVKRQIESTLYDVFRKYVTNRK